MKPKIRKDFKYNIQQRIIYLKKILGSKRQERNTIQLPITINVQRYPRPFDPKIANKTKMKNSYHYQKTR